MRARGFTLVELMIVLAIIAALLATLLSFTKVGMQEYEREVNDTAVEKIRTALEQFYGEFGYYPCPAGPRYPLGDPAHGVEQRYTASNLVPVDATLLPGATWGRGRCKILPDQPGVTGGVFNFGTIPPEVNPITGIVRAPGFKVDPLTGTFVNQNFFQYYPGNRDSVGTLNTSVLIGDIPYVTMQQAFENLAVGKKKIDIPFQATLDAHGQKFVYAITEYMTHEDTIKPTEPMITVRKFNYAHVGTNRTVTNDNRSVPYLIFSSGRDRLGTYNRLGILSNPTACTVTAEVNTNFSRNTNCDRDAIFLTTAGANTNLSYAINSDTHYFDDIVSYTPYTDAVLWSPVKANTVDMRNANSGNIGIGVEPHSAIKMDVAGNARADKIFAYNICAGGSVTTFINPTGNCFDPRVIAGNPDVPSQGGMKCPAGQVLVQIGGNTGTFSSVGSVRFTCEKPALTNANLANKSCPGQWVVGFNSNGTLRCGP